MKEQSYATHRRFVPVYHYWLTLLVVAALVGSLVNAYRAVDRGSGRIAAAVILLLAVIALVEGLLLRTFALKAQDRAIRIEENLRHYILHGSVLDPGLNTRQIIGLRVASDDEFSSLAKQALDENLS